MRVRSTREPRPAMLARRRRAGGGRARAAEDGVSPRPGLRHLRRRRRARARVLGGGTIARAVETAARPEAGRRDGMAAMRSRRPAARSMRAGRRSTTRSTTGSSPTRTGARRRPRRGPGPEILEVGVGTGLVPALLPGPEPRRSASTSPRPMLRQGGRQGAHGAAAACPRRRRDGRLPPRASPTRASTRSTVPFVITLVPDPEGALDECARVLQARRRIVISSKLGAGRAALSARLEEAVDAAR